MSTIDLTPLVQGVMPLVGIALTTIAGLLAHRAIAYLHIAGNSALARQIETAADAGAGIALDFMHANAASIEHVDIHNAALAMGANHALASVPQAMAALGITPEHVAAMVKARVGLRLGPPPSAATKVAAVPAPAAAA